ncbi:MAG: L,D-transpeptidase [Bacteroidota bacterium]|nr:L,D-transpeptidase [Bacteroidota bacterium]MDP4192111.1 L,D-transpeptidase [Bacteroidota bacterium]MDP4195461.1 L,D-transpeptidase [Bacteroidota bacterium]
MIKSILYFISSLVVFLAGMILYGMILNLREVTLSEAAAQKHLTYLTNIHIIVEKRKYKLELYSDTTLVKTYKAVFGRSSSTKKSFLNDKRTPVGKYVICDIDTTSQYRKFLRLNFPNSIDIQEAYKQRLITENEFLSASEALQNNQCPKLGRIKTNDIGIHGIGRLNFIFKNLPFVYNWTNGSIAVSNENIDEIYSVIKVGTEVEIKE